jgi:UDP-N-acetylglucosamine:LPS N-acetylglucosamine transferase
VVNLKASYRRKALAVLQSIPGLRYRVFPKDGEDFDTALLDCAGVISPAGHQVLAEALALGKPVLTLPQVGQPEQALNAQQLVQTGRGRVGSLDTFEADLKGFVASLELLASRPMAGSGFLLKDGTPDLVAKVESFLAQRVAV